ncbi:hypothetical protein [Halovenus salina]|uniref:hypothetical protein n=1 Tax=Halovenus salina TaxID=1510225 RepID=UPI002260AAFD|nr:hypothetical protein [Halovenus salina]
MSKYERAYGTDWESLDEDEGMERAYALGVATSLGEPLPDELAAIREEMDTAYQRSVVDLAFEEGETEALEVDATATDEPAKVWDELVDDEPVTVDPDDVPTGGRQGLPEAVDKFGALDRPDIDSTNVVDLPEFLQEDDE